MLPLHPRRGIYRPPGWPVLNPAWAWGASLADIWLLNPATSAATPGAAGSPIVALSVLGQGYRGQHTDCVPAMTQFGSGVKLNGSSQYINATAGNGRFRTQTGQQTQIFVGQLDGTVAHDQTFFSVESHSVVKTNASMQFANGTSTFKVNWISTSTISGNFAQSVTVGKPFVAAMTLNYASNATATMFYNGVKSTVVGTGAQATVATDEIAFGNAIYGSTDRAQYFNGVCIMGALFTSILSDDLIWSLLRDPFQMLEWPEDRLWLPMRGAPSIIVPAASGRLLFGTF